MKQKYSLIMDDEFIQYCKLNGIEDIDKKAKEVFKQGFDLLKYGDTPKIDPKKVIVVEPVMIKENKSTPEPRKEDAGERRPKNKDIVLAEPQTIVKAPKKDLYDEG